MELIYKIIYNSKINAFLRNINAGLAGVLPEKV